MMIDNLDLIKKAHNDIFGEDPQLIVHAPGRINLIGEHTDYSEGFVMPLALNMGITLGISQIPNAELISIFSMDNNKKMVSNYTSFFKSSEDWFNYPLGVTKIMRERGYSFSGMRITFTGNLPQGVGLASSAALEVATAFAINELFKLKIPKKELAKICQEAEHHVVGVKCGVMDQFISLLGEKNNCLFIDCRTLDHELIPLNLKGAKIIITNSNVAHKLNNSQYNERVRDCEDAVKIMSVSKEGTHLRDFNMEDYVENRKLLDPDVSKRAFHVISENERVLEAKNALKSNDLTTLGKLLNESQESLKTNYEVSTPELDWLTSSAQSMDECYGSRLTGAGFGGCTISIFKESGIAKYKEKLKIYEEKFKKKPVVYESMPEQGVHILFPK